MAYQSVMCSGWALTVVVNLVGVRHQPAVVWSRRQGVRDPVVVVIVVALVTEPVFVGVQLGAVDHERAIILGILVTVAITTGEETQSHDVNKEAVVPAGVAEGKTVCVCTRTQRRDWKCYHLSWFVSQESPTRSLSMSDWNKSREFD